jgi:hypothetical protein
MTPNSKKNSLKKIEKPSPINPTKSSNGWKETKMLKSKNIKPNKKKWKLSGTQSCKNAWNAWRNGWNAWWNELRKHGIRLITTTITLRKNWY